MQRVLLVFGTALLALMAGALFYAALPFTMIVAADGELLTTHIGEIHREDLDHIVAVLGQLDRGEIDKETARADLMTL